MYAWHQPMSDIELREMVTTAIDHGVNYLRRIQHQASGAWRSSINNPVGLTSLAVLAQLNCDVPTDAPQLRKGLRFLRRTTLAQLPANSGNYEASLLLMALCAAREYDIDRPQIQRLAREIQDSQVTEGPDRGLWNYGLVNYSGPLGHPDRSNGQFAVLALRDAANAGVEIDQNVWERVRDHWETKQNPDGGWSYHTPLTGRGPTQLSTGSMTVAGLSTISIAARMLQDDSNTDPDGKVDCCSLHPPPVALTKGHNWLAERFSILTNPGHGHQHLYYLYGLERAGRLTGVRLFGPHDWYRSGSRYLADPQYDARHEDGRWQTANSRNPILATSYALLFLSKGLSRIVVNKLDYTSDTQNPDPNGEWNRHYLDIANLIDHIDSTENQGWPPRLNSQVLTLSKLREPTAVSDMNQAPVLYISGSKAPVFSDQQVSWLRKYIDEGGFIYAQANCKESSFGEGIRNLVTRMFPDEEASLTGLSPDHPVFRSQHLLNSAGFELSGVDFGCRTSVIYSPEDHACYWHKWMRHPPRERSLALNQRILRSIRLGVNVIAYATGKQPPDKLNDSTVQNGNPEDRITRGLLEIAQLRHDGGWNTAPGAVGNVLLGLNRTTGLGVSATPRSVPLTLQALSEYPIAWMHGRFGFSLRADERNALRDYLSRGPVLIADACCGSKQFDTSFRDLMQLMYPEHRLKPIPDHHLMFTEATGFDVRKVSRRRLETRSATVSIQSKVLIGPPRFEGIQINGQYVVIYSPYDLSCALDNQTSLACNGYLKEDAMKLAINMLLFAQDQEITAGPLSENKAR